MSRFNRFSSLSLQAVQNVVGTGEDSTFLARNPTTINANYIQPDAPNNDCWQCRVPDLESIGSWIDGDAFDGMGRLCVMQYHPTPAGSGSDIYNCFYGGTDRLEPTSKWDHHHKFTGTVWIAQRTAIPGHASDTGGVVLESRLGIKAKGLGETGAVIRTVEPATGVSGKQVVWIDPIITDPVVGSTLIVTAVASDAVSNPNLTYTRFTRQWQPAGAYKSADESVTASTTIQADDHLVVTVAAAGKYKFRLQLFSTNAGAAPGVKLALGGSATATKVNASLYVSTSIATNPTLVDYYSALDAGITYNNGTDPAEYIIEGSIEVNAGGTFGLKWAQETSDAAAAKILRGSSLTITRLG
jgi:hypothetical protein